MLFHKLLGTRSRYATITVSLPLLLMCYQQPATDRSVFHRAVAEALGRRMIDFQEEWFDEPARVVALLERIVDLSPAADWAFDRLKLAFNAAGRWPELFALYDRALERSTDDAFRIEMLREAAMAAKDKPNRMPRMPPNRESTTASIRNCVST